MRRLVAPVGYEAVVVGEGGEGGGRGASRRPTTRGPPPRRAPRARGPASCISLMWERGCRRHGAAVSDRGQAWMS